MIKAAVDVGSNSVLLVVSEWDGRQWTILNETSEVTGLGVGTKTTGLLSEESMAKTLLALRRAFDTASSFGAKQIQAGGTMALRIANNAEDFLQRAETQGTPVRVISGDDEADLGFQAVANDPIFRGESRLVVVDPGGHSTELLIAERVQSKEWSIKFKKSYAVGALGLREGYLAPESPDHAARLKATVLIDGILGEERRDAPAGKVVALGATGTNLISIREGLKTWQPDMVHGSTLTYEELSHCVGWMFDLTDAERAALKGIEPGRQHTIHIGCLILERFLFHLGAQECTVSVRGWRHAFLEGNFLRK